MNIEVQIKARFVSGAEITLSEKQLAQATKLVEGIILYGVKKAPQEAPQEAHSVAKQSRTRNKYKKWTSEEDAELEELAQKFPKGSQGVANAISLYAQRHGRSRASVESRVYNIRKDMGQSVSNIIVHRSDKNHAFGSGFQRNFNPNQA